MGVIVCATVLASSAGAADKFQKLSGGQIQAKLPGMEMTDGTHWRDIFERNGSLVSYAMGKRTVGSWRVQTNELCLERIKGEGADCYQVWIAGPKIELRREGSTIPLEGTLQRVGAVR
jgi:hypothetical protein